MRTPRLDKREHQDILREIQEKARAYTPEWHYEGVSDDPGGALCEIFADMFSETIDRLNGVPHKNYVAFLNLLDARRQPMQSARGVVRFLASPPEGAYAPIPIPRGATLYASEEEGEERTLFETTQAIQATSAELLSMYYVCPAFDHVEQLELNEDNGAFLFTMTPQNNMQQHSFALMQEDVFAVARPCALRLELEFAVRFYTAKCIEALSDGEIAAWSYFNGEAFLPFDRVEADSGALLLYKESNAPIVAQNASGEPLACIRCDIKGGDTLPPLQLSSAGVKSAYLKDEATTPDVMFHNEDPVDAEIGGYCFGRRPTVYDCFYIACDEVLSKRGARISITMDMKTMLKEQANPEELYEFRKKYFIDKSEVNKDLPRIYVERVIFEYWNGAGWRALAVEGDKNPFSCQHDGEKTLHFICPDDIEKGAVNAVSAYFIRARIAFVENAFDTLGTLLLPLVQSIHMRFDYEAAKPLTGLIVRNNCDETAFYDEAGLYALNVALFKALEQQPPAHYLLFDRPFWGHPLTMYFKLPRNDAKKRVIQFELGREDDFLILRALDGAENMRRSGVVSLFIPERPAKRKLFGQEGYWLKITDRSAQDAAGQLYLSHFYLNAVEIVQRHTAPPMVFDAGVYEAGMELRLRERPVLEADVWVNETKLIPSHMLEQMQSDEAFSPRLRIERDAAGEVQTVYIKYERVSSFLNADQDSRVYMLEQQQGIVRFGDGQRGKLPPEGESAVLVEYKSGGGARGNMPLGAIDAFEGSLPMITGVKNIAPVCGGSDLQDISAVERVQRKRLVHRSRALTREDYECLVEEYFPQVRDVRAFAGVDADGKERKGHITIAVMGNGFEEESYAQLLSDEVYAFLQSRCDMQVRSLALLHVIGAQVVTVHVRLRLLLDDFNNAAQAELSAKEAIARMIETKREDGHFIGNLPKRADVYAACKDIVHVDAVQDVMLEGSYVEKGIVRLIALDEQISMPFAVALCGKIAIQF